MTTADESESGEDISIFGRSSRCYTGKIYSDKWGSTTLSGRAIVCLANSDHNGFEWKHVINSVYYDDIEKAFNHFKIRDDISHLILLPQNGAEYDKLDKVDDLIRNYLHS